MDGGVLFQGVLCLEVGVFLGGIGGGGSWRCGGFFWGDGCLESC